MKKPLSPLPRRPLTDRECASILGGLISVLAQNSSVEAARNAVRWWADTDEAWAAIEQAEQFAKQLLAAQSTKSPQA